MLGDRKKIYIISFANLSVLLIALVVSERYNEMLCAAVMCIAAGAVSIFIKKRDIYAYTKRQVTQLMGFVGFLYVSVYILSGLAFGFVKPLYVFSFNTLWQYILPVSATVVASEILRSVMLAQKDKRISVLSYVICVLSEVLLSSTVSDIRSANLLVYVVAQISLPAITSNLLYHYLSRRYGAYPNIAYRLIISLFVYIIPVDSAVPDALFSLYRLLVPVFIYFFIDGLYEKKRRYALGKKKVLSYAASGIVIVMGVLVVMLVSCQFRFGLLVIGSPSMTGEINTGDAIIYEEYSDQKIENGQVIVFKKGDTTVVHRVVDIEIINNQRRYTTKGDANEHNDDGYITDANLVGVVRWKMPFIGYPTVMLRRLFD